MQGKWMLKKKRGIKALLGWGDKEMDEMEWCHGEIPFLARHVESWGTDYSSVYDPLPAGTCLQHRGLRKDDSWSLMWQETLFHSKSGWAWQQIRFDRNRGMKRFCCCVTGKSKMNRFLIFFFRVRKQRRETLLSLRHDSSRRKTAPRRRLLEIAAWVIVSI